MPGSIVTAEHAAAGHWWWWVSCGGRRATSRPEHACSCCWLLPCSLHRGRLGACWWWRWRRELLAAGRPDGATAMQSAATPQRSQVPGRSLQVPAMHFRTVRRRGHSERTTGGRAVGKGWTSGWARARERSVALAPAAPARPQRAGDGGFARWPSAAALARCPAVNVPVSLLVKKTFLSPRFLHRRPDPETSCHLVSAVKFGWMATGNWVFFLVSRLNLFVLLDTYVAAVTPKKILAV